MDNERFIGDANKLSLSRGRKGGPEGMQGPLTLNMLPRARLGLQAVAVVALPSSVRDAHCCWVGLFEENRQFSVLGPFYRYRLLASRFAFNPPVVRVLLLCYPLPSVFYRFSSSECVSYVILALVAV